MTTKKGKTVYAARSKDAISTIEIMSILLMLAGRGWLSGTYAQPITAWWGVLSDVLQFLPLVALLWLSLVYFRALLESRYSKIANIGISIVAVLSMFSCAVFIVASMKNPNAFAAHTFMNLLPVLVLNAGTILWLAIPKAAYRPVRAAAPLVDASL